MKKIIYYDPKYNFHNGYHSQLIKATEKSIRWKKAKIFNYFEDCIWNKQNIDLSNHLFNFGYFSIQNQSRIILSPHIFLSNKNRYIMSLESIYWLFADTYKNASRPVDTWKITLFSELVTEPRLKAVFWYSNAAKKQFNKFAKSYKLTNQITEDIDKKSHIINPPGPQIKRRSQNTSNNQFVIVANGKNWKRKGLDLSLNLFKELKKEKIDNWKLHIVGNNIPTELNKEIIALKNNVITYGEVPQSKLLHLISQSPFLLFPSRADTYGTILIQAINAGAFIIASYGKNTIATREILNNYPNKYLIKSKGCYRNNLWLDVLDEKEFYKSIKYFILNPFILKKTRLNKYSYKGVKEKILNIVADI